MDFPAPGFRVTAPRDTLGNERKTDSAALARTLRLDEPTTDPVEILLAEEARASRQAYLDKLTAQQEKGKASGKKNLRPQSQTIRANFNAADVFERKSEQEKPRQVGVFRPIGSDEDGSQGRKTGGDDRQTEGGSSKHGKGLGKKIGNLFKRDKSER